MLEFYHFLLVRHLDQARALIHVGSFDVRLLGQFLGLLEDWHRLTSESTFVDQCFSFQYNGIEGNFNLFFQEHYVSGDELGGRDVDHVPTSQAVDDLLIVGHLIDLFVVLISLHQVRDDTHGCSHKNDTRVIVVHFIDPERAAEKNKQVEWSHDLPEKQHWDRRHFYDHHSWPVGLNQMGHVFLGEVGLFLWGFMSHNFVVPINKVVRGSLNRIVFHEIGHVSIFEEGDFAGDAIGEVEESVLLVGVCGDLIIVDHMKMRGLFQRTLFEVNFTLQPWEP